MQEEKAGRDEERARLRRAALPDAAFETSADSLFERSFPVLNDELRASALAAYRNLLRSIGEGLLFELEEHGPALDLQAAIGRVLETPAFRSPALASALAHRAEEHVSARRIQDARSHFLFLGDASAGGPVDSWTRDEDETLAARAAAFLQLRPARKSEGAGPQLHADELPKDVAAAVHWSLAAALCEKQPIEVAHAVSAATQRLVGEHDAVRSPQFAAIRLVRRLHERGDLEDRLLLELTVSGELLLLGAAAAVRGGISTGTAWLLLMRGEAATTMTLLAALKLRAPAHDQLTALLLYGTGRVAALDGALDLASAAGERVDEAAAQEALEWWQLSPMFRAAAEKL